MKKLNGYASPACSWGDLDAPDAGAVLPAEFRADLIRKFGRPGPRYTSYPTAPQFRDDLPHELLLADLQQIGAKSRPLSLYFHLPFCETQCWFCGCTRVITRNRGAADGYLDYLGKEVSLLQPYLGGGREVVQIHLGGGTPTFLSARQLRRLGQMIQDSYTLAPDCESSAEIDPRRLEREQVDALREIGFNRASLGVQDHNPDVQRQINRIQPETVTNQAIAWLREAGFSSVNVDLIYGLPSQTLASFSQTVESILEQQPDRVALFGYAHVPWISPSQKIFDRRGNLPDGETRLALLEQACGQLAAAGYVYIGMDHFALPTDPLAMARKERTLQRNFQGYSTRAGVDICAFGMSAISQTPASYRQNVKDLKEYYARLDAGNLPIARGYRLTEEDQIRRDIIMRIMCELRLDFREISDQYGFRFQERFGRELQDLAPLAEAGLIALSNTELEVTPVGQFLLRNIAMPFDAYLSGGPGRYSKTI